MFNRILEATDSYSVEDLETIESCSMEYLEASDS
jgi:hypothetical protein